MPICSPTASGTERQDAAAQGMSTEILIVLGLILLNGFFALSEMAVVTARRSRLRQDALESKGAQAALEMAEAPEKFLSSVQVWITLLGILTGYFGGETIAVRISAFFAKYPLVAEYSHGLGVAVGMGLILLLSVVLGELLPKRVAIIHAERIAAAVAIPMRVLAMIAKPAAWVLAFSTELLMRMLRITRGDSQQVTEEEIKHLVAEGAEQGVIDNHERNMVNRVLGFGDRTVDELMVPRTDIVWLDQAASLEHNLQVMRERNYSRYPVMRGGDHDVVGVLQLKNLMESLTGKGPIDLFREMSPVLFVPESARALSLMEKFRDTEAGLALVVDEYGDIRGLVTLSDLMTAVFGRMISQDESSQQAIVQRSDGSWLVDGRVGLDDLRELLGVSTLPHEEEQDFRSAAGLMIAQFGRIPQVGEHFSFAGFRMEVVDLDGARIDKLLIERVVPPEPQIDV
jgi:putative hemolysin